MLIHPRTLVFCVLALCAPLAHAQLGPSPSELPPRASTVPQADSEPLVNAESDGSRVRPAIDEMLMARARQGADPVSGEVELVPASSTLRKDLRASEPVVTSIVGASDDQAIGPGGGLPSMSDGWGQTIIALGGVLLLIFGVAQVFKRLSRSQGGLAGQLGAGGSAPSGILEVIGRYPIASGMTLVVLKFDRRVLLVSSSAGSRGKHGRGASMQTLCELTDPEDVASVLLKSRSASGESIAQSFQRALQDADDLTDDSIYRHDEPVQQSVNRPRATRQGPARTITTDEGDRAELWSGGSDGQAAARVLRDRLAAMRPGAGVNRA